MRDPVETYFTALRDIHASGAGVAEVSYYGYLPSGLPALRFESCPLYRLILREVSVLPRGVR